MGNKKTEQLSLDLENKAPSKAQDNDKANPARPAAVISFQEKKAERNGAEERKLFKQILGLVKHFQNS